VGASDVLFNSYGFLLIFLPLALAGFWLVSAWLGRQGRCLLPDPGIPARSTPPGIRPDVWVIVILDSGQLRRRQLMAGADEWSRGRSLCWFGHHANLCYLGCQIRRLPRAKSFGVMGRPIPLAHIALPLGISFFTFQADYLSGGHFPQSLSRLEIPGLCQLRHLLPAPDRRSIVHYGEILPQFNDARAIARPGTYGGGISFCDGVDEKSPDRRQYRAFRRRGVRLSAHGTVTFLDAWFRRPGVHFQIYFDFFGYSDMAIGLARMSASPCR